MRRFGEIVGTLVLLGLAIAAVLNDGLAPSVASSPLPAIAQPPGEVTPTVVGQWRDALAAGRAIEGSINSPVEVIVLSDLQCGACRIFHEMAREVVAARQPDVGLVFVHYPIKYHPQAMIAAKWAECVGQADATAVRRWVEAVFAQQDSLPFRPMARYAIDAGVASPRAIEQCASGESIDRDARIMKGLAFGDRIHITGTPTVLVNDLLFAQPPLRGQLEHTVDSILAAPRS